MDHALFKSIVSYLIIASIFITGEGFEGFGFNLYWYYPVYILFLAYGILFYHKINPNIAIVFSLIVIYSYLTYDLDVLLVTKQVINICFSAAVFYYFLLHEKFDFERIFQKYITFAKIVLILGFIQVILFTFEQGHVFTTVFPFLASYTISDRLQSVTQEPSYISLTFAPIVFIALHNILYRTRYFMGKKWSLLFLVGYVLTQSSIAFVGLLMAVLLLYFKNFSFRKLQYFVLAAFGAGLVMAISYQMVHSVKLRVDDTFYAITKDITNEAVYKRINLSTYALLSNVHVTKRSLENEFWTGNGLGTHQVAYESFLPVEMQKYSSLNKEDGNSMALRMLSEVGAFGFLLFCLFVLRYKVRSKPSHSPEQSLLWAINTAILIIIMLSLLRNGNYTVHGKILFFMIYYYSYKQVKSLTSVSNKQVYEQDLQH